MAAERVAQFSSSSSSASPPASPPASPSVAPSVAPSGRRQRSASPSTSGNADGRPAARVSRASPCSTARSSSSGTNRLRDVPCSTIDASKTSPRGYSGRPPRRRAASANACATAAAAASVTGPSPRTSARSLRTSTSPTMRPPESSATRAQKCAHMCSCISFATRSPL
ncbi:hypothetical protein BJF79_32930 [Actinomadura sp. CNU-125]|uniref:hypothetical protein n=1 Tax=Actinomadura sp. CNU-125 TaxID=1904961 RepID=UPI000959A7BE|nr:hypothetical protein [Actinomadura sp. CNU-125]OLT34789.1 hypothetical protein BJF79_32930 [Actinomadura sp. CNU-125]